MPEIGQSLLHYSITEKIGKGGMGEVYRAKDQKLGRDVAIKVLPEEFAREADRVARFQREAKLLASLNHPNIASIYGMEESNKTNFLVMELVEGDTLADRIKTGPVPVEEALKLALQTAEALESAHEKGVIHRDLKPANIKVTQDGKVKVLDFGLAKAFAGEQAELNLSNSPTLSDMATMQGVILGTAAYMSPEQARGKAVDKRADIWAFGAVFYEMLTGQAAFQGEDVTEILAAVVKGGANLDLLPVNLHPRLREVISRCLQRDLNRRYQDIRDARYEIEQALADPRGVLPQGVTAVELRKRIRVGLSWVAAALVLGLIAAGLAVWYLKPSESRQVVRFDCDIPEDQQLNGLGVDALAVSPDGIQFVYSTTKGLFKRSLDELTAKLIPGTEGNTRNPFFSPDGKSIGYLSVVDGQLKKIAINGGAPVTLCGAAALAGASWGVDNRIVFGLLQRGTGIMRISADGGTPEILIKAKSEVSVFPQFLPDGKSILYTASGRTSGRIMVYSLNSGESKELFAGIGARYLPTGHLVYRLPNNNNLFSVAFDPKKLEVAGEPVPLVEGVSGSMDMDYDVSNTGMLVYLPGTTSAAETARTLVWVDRNGKEEPLTAAPNEYSSPRISPDGTRVALTVGSSDEADIYILDLIHKSAPTRLTFDKVADTYPLWTPDGKRIVFASSREDHTGLFWKAADGTGETEKLGTVTGSRPISESWSSGGNTLLYEDLNLVATNADIFALSIEGERVSKPLLQEKYVTAHPQISPDGGWMAYMSSESGQYEVFVCPFPDVKKGKWQVSLNGGQQPKWSPDGRELFYCNGDAMMAVAVETLPTFRVAGVAKELFRGNYYSEYGHQWDLSRDGKRFLMIKQPGNAPSAGGGLRKINIVLNWFEELKQRVTTK